MTTAAERFEAKYEPEPTSGCWVWHGAQSRCGNGFYGFFWDTELRKLVNAHRWAAKHIGGMDVEGGQVNHTCDNGLCVNPDHLYLGTQKQNIRDAHRRKRKPEGSACSWAKLSNKQVRTIRAMRDDGDTWQFISEEMGLPLHLVGDVLRGKTYRSVS